MKFGLVNQGVNRVLPAEIKCLKCVHCTIEQTGVISCAAYQGQVPKGIVMAGPSGNCGELVYRRLRGQALEQREGFLKKRAALG